MSIKISYRDGFWYVDVRQSPAGAFKPTSRHSTIESALDSVRDVAKSNEEPAHA